jgi:hypothetical protein
MASHMSLLQEPAKIAAVIDEAAKEVLTKVKDRVA